MLFTTSWDDGYQLDQRVADLLSQYGCSGTFYVCPEAQYGQPMLEPAEIKALDAQHEVGAHTLTHPKLSRLESAEAAREIQESKQWIESITGRPCTMFCYPYGNESSEVRRLVQAAGFTGARTVEPLQFASTGDPYGLPTSLQIYPFPWRKRWTRWWHLIDPVDRLRVQYRQLRALRIPVTAYRSWLAVAKALFLHALNTQQPFFHLWGHSQELKRYNQWRDLERFLAFVKQHGVEHGPNSALVNAAE